MYVKFLVDQERYGELNLDWTDLSYLGLAVKSVRDPVGNPVEIITEGSWPVDNV